MKTKKTGKETDEGIVSGNDLPLALYGMITQIMLFVKKMDEDYTLRSMTDERNDSDILISTGANMKQLERRHQDKAGRPALQSCFLR